MLLCACSSETPAIEPSPPDAPPSLPPGIDRFAGLDPRLPTSDLEPLWKLVGDARIVGLGESVHTSGGFYAAKHRLIRVLVEERGFRTFAMETPRLQAAPMRAFLESGNCDGPTDRDVISSSIFRVFADDNTVALMRWLCHWNVDHPNDQVVFYGFDMQEPAEDRAALVDFFTAHAPNDVAMLEQGIASCIDDYVFVPQTAAVHAECTAGLDVMDAYFAAHATELGASAGERAVRLARLASSSWRAFQDEVFFSESDIDRAYEARDREMAHVFDELLELEARPGGVVLWAHDGHLSAARVSVSGQIATMGTHLRASHQRDYIPIAITAGRAEINWPGVGNGPTQIGTDPESIEAQLAQFDSPYLIVDARSPWVPTSGLRVGGIPIDSSLRDYWDAVIYLAHSPPMNAVFW